MTTNRTRIVIRDIVVDTAPTTDTGAFGGGSVTPPPPPPPTLWNPFTESLTLSQWQANTGLTAVQYINPWDYSTVSFSTSPAIASIADKTGNGNNMVGSGGADLIIDGTRNSVRFNSAFASSTTLANVYSGNMFDKPFVIGLVFTFRRNPVTNKECLWSCGHSSTNGNRALYITTGGNIEYAYTPDSGSTYSTTSSDAVPFDTPVMIWLACERSRARVYLHGGSFDHKKILSTNGGINANLTVDQSLVGAWIVSGATTNGLSVADWHGLILAQGVVQNTFNAIEQSCDLFKVPWTNTDVSTLDNGLVGELVFPGPGGVTPTGDAVELLSNIKFAAVGTVATTTGAFHNAFSQAADANRYSNATAVDSNWDVFNKPSFTLHLKVKPSEVSSNRAILQIGTSPYLKVYHQDIGGGVYKIRVDLNGTIMNSTTTIANNTDYDIHIWADASLTVNLQVNGDTAVTAARSAYSSAIGQGIYIGSTHTPSFYYRGVIDQIRVWNRALSLEERKQTSITAGSRDGFCQYLTSGIYSGSWGGGGAAPTTIYVGSQVAGITNGNVQLKSSSTAAGSSAASWVTFIAPKSGALRQFIQWWKTNESGQSGYSGGTGGVYTASVRTDNGSNAPSATVVSQVTGLTFTIGNSTDNIRTTTFTTIGNVTAGTKYHMILANTDAAPSTNWLCMNMVQNGSGVSKPVWGAGDFGYHHGGTAIGTYQYNDGVAQVAFGIDTNADSTTDYWFGSPYISPVSKAYYTMDDIGGANFGGFLFKSPTNITVQKFTFAGFRTAGTGDVTVKLKTALSGGTVLATAVCPGSQLASSATTGTPTQWSTGNFDVNYTCLANTDYYITLQAPSGTTIYPSLLQDMANGYGGPSIIDGSKGGFWGNTSVLQRSTNSGSTWGGYAVSGATGKHDLSFYVTGI